MPQHGGTLRSAVMTLDYFLVLWVHEQFKSNENPANGRGVLLINVPVVLKHINKVFPRP